MQMIDAHAHVFEQLCGFGADGELRAIGGGKARWATGEVIDLIPAGYGEDSFTAEALLSLMEKPHVERAVLLQGGFLGFANDYVHDVCGQYPKRFAGAATFDPWCRNACKILDNLLDNLKFRIFKFEMSVGCGIMGNHPDFDLDCSLMMGFYEYIAANNGIVVFDMGSPGDASNQPGAVRAIAETFPALHVVVCHLMSPRRNHLHFLQEGLEVMKRENIHFDLAALHWKVRPEAYPFPTAQAFITLARNTVGADHLMWGTDVPSTLTNHSFEELVDYMIPLFNERERQLVFHDNALRLYFGECE